MRLAVVGVIPDPSHGKARKIVTAWDLWAAERRSHGRPMVDRRPFEQWCTAKGYDAVQLAAWWAAIVFSASRLAVNARLAMLAPRVVAALDARLTSPTAKIEDLKAFFGWLNPPAVPAPKSHHRAAEPERRAPASPPRRAAAARDPEPDDEAPTPSFERDQRSIANAVRQVKIEPPAEAPIAADAPAAPAADEF